MRRTRRITRTRQKLKRQKLKKSAKSERKRSVKMRERKFSRSRIQMAEEGAPVSVSA